MLNDLFFMQTIWLIGGTQESAELAQSIADLGIPCLVTVTTESAKALYPVVPTLKIWVGRLQADQLPAFFQEHGIAAVLDASHPFAVEISQQAIAASTQFDIPYLRYERLPLQVIDSCVIAMPNITSLLCDNLLDGQRVLLTLGYRSLALFQPWQQRATLFARILPSVTALEAAILAGFTPDRIIAMRPPVSAELERSLWQQWQITMVVTKASGAAGGEDIKRQVAADLGVQLVVLERPPIAYPQQTSDVAVAIQFCQQFCCS